MPQEGRSRVVWQSAWQKAREQLWAFRRSTRRARSTSLQTSEHTALKGTAGKQRLNILVSVVKWDGDIKHSRSPGTQETGQEKQWHSNKQKKSNGTCLIQIFHSSKNITLMGTCRKRRIQHWEADLTLKERVLKSTASSSCHWHRCCTAGRAGQHSLDGTEAEIISCSQADMRQKHPWPLWLSVI